MGIVANAININRLRIVPYKTVMGIMNVGTLGVNLSQVVLQETLSFRSLYATKVLVMGEANNEGGTGK